MISGFFGLFSFFLLGAFRNQNFMPTTYVARLIFRSIVKFDR